MNHWIIVAGVGAVALVGIAALSGDDAPVFPDRNFDYKNASFDDKARWLQKYGQALHYHVASSFKSKNASFDFVSVNPDRRAANFEIRLTYDAKIDEKTLKSELFQKAVDKKAAEAQRDICYTRNIAPWIVGDSKIVATLLFNEHPALTLEVSEEICQSIKNNSVLKKLTS